MVNNTSILVLIVAAVGLMGCGAFKMDQQEYVLKLADKCSSIQITPQKTALKCPNLVEGENGNGNRKSGSATNISREW